MPSRKNVQFSATALILSILVSIAAAAQSDYQRGLIVPVANNEFKIMSYNLFNLFDTVHDEGKNDWNYLPQSHPGKDQGCNEDRSPSRCRRSDWTNEKFRLKVMQLAKAMSQQGSRPDLLAVEEIENERAAQALGQYLGYNRMLMTNSPDRRGIDVALFWNPAKLDYIEHRELDVSSRINKATRNILQVHFRPLNSPKAVFGVFVNHWPSQGTPDSSVRIGAAQVLQSAIDSATRAYGSDYYAIATGDFNVINNEGVFEKTIMNPSWQNQLFDTHTLAMRTGDPMMRLMPPGSYFFTRDHVWNQLDRFFINRNLVQNSEIDVVPTSFRIVAGQVNTRTFVPRGGNGRSILIPYRGNFDTLDPEKAGYSDHFPIVVKFRVNR